MFNILIARSIKEGYQANKTEPEIRAKLNDRKWPWPQEDIDHAFLLFKSPPQAIPYHDANLPGILEYVTSRGERIKTLSLWSSMRLWEHAAPPKSFERYLEQIGYSVDDIQEALRNHDDRTKGRVLVGDAESMNRFFNPELYKNETNFCNNPLGKIIVGWIAATILILIVFFVWTFLS